MTIQVLSTVTDKPHPYRFNEVDNWVPFEPYEISKSIDGNKWTSVYDVPDLKDIYCYKADIDKANPVDTLRTFAGTDGQTVDSTRYETRTITLHFVARTINIMDTDIVSDELQRYFASRTPYWIVIAGKYGRAYERWLVKAGQLKVIEADEHWALVDVPLTNLSGYAQSVVNSVEFMTNPSVYGGFEMGLLDKSVLYTQTTASFQIFNPSDVPVDPLQQHHDITITITGTGAPTLTNTTNKTSFAFKKALKSSDTLKLAKVNPYLNNVQDGLDSDHGWIQLEPGWNSFTLTGLSNLKIVFDFAWYFLS
ncbi:phage tail domain-containing protein [Loigolactobacillus coryniformis]|uniref:Prophage P2a protein 49 n=1 Tax=Loigolactobacillus coryniformis subsp. coryniformis CECT 5711 TaxID=1185325 RepID=J3JC85_9LACO|nr:phage tail domain-containing protein [Loigolactobacillus coryniformis]EJN56377.1 Prophage P2a protein 49 [Loigolactobacillus coryniformis subsp. coryniformis CECT 5711]